MIEAACSFCGRTREKAEVLVAGPACYICESCIELAFDILAESREKRTRPWVERLRAAIDDLCASVGDPVRDAALAAVLDEPDADDRLRDAGQAARRMFAELREIRATVRVAVESKKPEDP